MQKTADFIIKNVNTFFVTGELDFSNVISVYEKSMVHIKKISEINFDFSKLKSSNSAGLALIIEWIKYAKTHKKRIHFLNLSDDLLAIANAAGIETLIDHSK